MSRQPTVLDTFYILDDHCNSNFMCVDVNGRASEFVNASYRNRRADPKIRVQIYLGQIVSANFLN